ncbi:MazG family protein [Peterkaempfera bronchialis]|uniref:MazG family protein n=1 Tax=Peterkaempfera bronchialis TaxID=2126346 RepID=A0A345T6A9_9ACTN|nr:MazG family protein [Peterkaempfera bronchialis]AXI81514.1 MazG family protein [Peterkaempfera bronchialis]
MPAPTGRLVLLTTTHRIAPGLLSWPAWETLRGADLVLVGDPAHPQLPAVRQAGVRVEPQTADTVPALARRLAETAAVPGRTVVWIGGADGDPGLTDALARLAVEGGLDPAPEIELLPGSYDLPGARLLDLVAVMDRMRSPGGCPWDAQQTHASLVKYLVEEAFELVEAIEEGDRESLREELGDVLFQVAFHARIAEEHAEEPFTIDDVAADLVEKLMYRHPHVFGDAEAGTPEQVEANWELLKAAEKQRGSAVDGVPLAQPALALAAKLVSRARKAGLDVPAGTPAPPPGGETPETAETAETTEAAVGEALLGLAARAQAEGIDPEAALRAAARRYRDAVQAAERQS